MTSSNRIEAAIAEQGFHYEPIPTAIQRWRLVITDPQAACAGEVEEAIHAVLAAVPEDAHTDDIVDGVLSICPAASSVPVPVIEARVDALR